MFAKIISKGIKDAFPCEKIGVAVVGLEVAHTHIHLIPINHVSDMDFSREKLKLSEDELSEDSLKIRQALNKKLRSEEQTSELQSLMRISYAVFCLKKKTCILRTKRTHIHDMTHTVLTQRYTE